jgi:hypothetical protein
MRNTAKLAVITTAAALLFPITSGCGKHPPAENVQDSSKLPHLTAEEITEGWMFLFNGKNFDGWRGLGREGLPAGHWIIKGEAIKKVPSGEVPLQEDGQPLAGGDLMTIAAFTDFELQFEWKISEAGNSGIKYNVSEDMSTAFPPGHAALGFEYQVLDDEKHPDAQNGENRTAAALYDLMAPQEKTLKPVGEYNTGRIVFIGNHGEHWLNGVKVLEYNLGTPEMEKRLEESKYSPIKGFADRRTGHIVLQDHTDAAWFRNIKIREIH